MPDYELRPVKLWETYVVLECDCGLAVDYPGHPDAETTCAGCGVTYGLETAPTEGATDG